MMLVRIKKRSKIKKKLKMKMVGKLNKLISQKKRMKVVKHNNNQAVSNNRKNRMWLKNRN